MSDVTTEGIVLKRTLFKEYDKIVSLFTSDLGIIKIFFKGSRRPNALKEALLSPLTRAQYTLKAGRDGFYFFKEGLMVNQHLKLREKYAFLKGAQQMALALDRSQWPNKPAPALYALFCKALEHISQLDPVDNLIAAFQLKVLRHEGALALDPTCTECHTIVKEPYRYGSELFCPAHAPLGATFLSGTSEKRLQTLTNTRSLAALQKIDCPQELLDLINKLFIQATD